MLIAGAINGEDDVSICVQPCQNNFKVHQSHKYRQEAHMIERFLGMDEPGGRQRREKGRGIIGLGVTKKVPNKGHWKVILSIM
jgi:hypothetical protein